ncbi:MAG: hypothetical protein FNT29_02095 [Halothiobacillaceae bacterium]|jgi:hypothetical protein|nr:MAG: hypothetical protein FNT29_02095 [Halothiobacillaceae bacterium]
MTNQASRRLIVEGEQEKFFFKTMLDKRLGLTSVDIQIYKPSDLGHTGNGISHLLTLIPEELDRIKTGEVTHLAFVADADDNFIDQISKIRQAFANKDFQPHPLGCTGDAFIHSSGVINPVGVWLMPSHQDSGAIERFFIESCSAEQKPCLDLAQASLAHHPCNHIQNTRWHDKAKTYTWLAWQKKPTFGYGDMHKKLDSTHPWMMGLEEWLQRIYP